MSHKYPGEQFGLECGECTSPMQLRESKYGPFYGCTNWPQCEGTHGAHPDGAPLGIPADKETKQWRMKTHDLFDQLWKKGQYSRSEAYELLQRLTGLPEEDCHIARFDIETCQRVIQKLKRTYIKQS